VSQPIPESIAPLPAALEEIRGRFEAAWQRASAGATLPRIEDHLGGQPEADRLRLLRELVAIEVACRRQRGEQPRVEEYQGRFPDLEPQWLDGALASTEGKLPRGHTLRCPHCHNPIQFAGELGEEVLCPGCGGSFRVRDARFTDTVSNSRPLGRFRSRGAGWTLPGPEGRPRPLTCVAFSPDGQRIFSGGPGTGRVSGRASFVLLWRPKRQPTFQPHRGEADP
jgi:hypothetical protein